MATPLHEPEPAAPPNRKARRAASRAPTLDQLRASRAVWATLPSGHEFLIRPPNMDMHVISGGLPGRFRRQAASSSYELNRLLADDAAEEQALIETRDYLMNVVRLMVIEPDLSELTSWEALDEVLIPEDFHFLLEICQRERSHDAMNRRLWGLEPLSRWDTFREQHRCPPDCPACLEVQRIYALAAARE